MTLLLPRYPNPTTTGCYPNHECCLQENASSEDSSSLGDNCLWENPPQGIQNGGLLSHSSPQTSISRWERERTVARFWNSPPRVDYYWLAPGNLDRRMLRLVIQLIKPGLGHLALSGRVSRWFSYTQVPQEALHNGIGGDSWGKKAPLVLWDKNYWGTITAQSYVDNVLIPVLQPFWNQESKQAGQHLWLMEDGASAHRGRFTTQAQEQYGIPKFAWPPSLLKLNPIENV